MPTLAPDQPRIDRLAGELVASRGRTATARVEEAIGQSDWFAG